MLRESHLKAALIDLFLEGRHLERGLVIGELPVAGWSRRADLVLANGRLIAFEIKSDADRTTRLEAQISAYRKSLEGVVVVTSERHASAVLRMADEECGIMLFVEENGRARFETLRKPVVRLLNADAALSLMNAPDLIRLLRALGMPLPKHGDRYSLERVARELSLASLRGAAIESLKRRYKSTYDRFLEVRAEQGSSLAALPLLRRPKWR